MRKILAAVGLVVALAIPVAALAATLDTGKFGDLIAYGDKCEDGAYYYFVNNQTLQNEKAPGGGTLTATFSGPSETKTAGPIVFNQYNQHFEVFSYGMLTGASTNLEGKLVLSHVTCKK